MRKAPAISSKSIQALDLKTPKNIDVLFVAGFGPIVNNREDSRRFYAEMLGLPLKEDTDDYRYTGDQDGVKHFSFGPLAQAAQSCFGTDQWDRGVSVPQGLEFDVEI